MQEILLVKFTISVVDGGLDYLLGLVGAL